MKIRLTQPNPAEAGAGAWAELGNSNEMEAKKTIQKMDTTRKKSWNPVEIMLKPSRNQTENNHTSHTLSKTTTSRNKVEQKK